MSRGRPKNALDELGEAMQNPWTYTQSEWQWNLFIWFNTIQKFASLVIRACNTWLRVVNYDPIRDPDSNYVWLISHHPYKDRINCKKRFDQIRSLCLMLTWFMPPSCPNSQQISTFQQWLRTMRRIIGTWKIWIHRYSKMRRYYYFHISFLSQQCAELWARNSRFRPIFFFASFCREQNGKLLVGINLNKIKLSLKFEHILA